MSNTTDTLTATTTEDPDSGETTEPTPGTTTQQAASPPQDETGDDGNLGIIIGVTVGAVALLIAAIIIAILLIRRKRLKAKQKPPPPELPNPYTIMHDPPCDHVALMPSAQWSNGNVHVTLQQDGTQANDDINVTCRDPRGQSAGPNDDKNSDKASEDNDAAHYVNFERQASEASISTNELLEEGVYSDPNDRPSLFGGSPIPTRDSPTRDIDPSRLDSMKYLMPVNHAESSNFLMGHPPLISKASSDSNVSWGSHSSTMPTPARGTDPRLKWRLTMPTIHKADGIDNVKEEEGEVYIDMKQTCPQKRISLTPPSPTDHEGGDGGGDQIYVNSDEEGLESEDDLGKSLPLPPPCGGSKHRYINVKTGRPEAMPDAVDQSLLYENGNAMKRRGDRCGEALQPGTTSEQNGTDNVYEFPGDVARSLEEKFIPQQASVKYANLGRPFIADHGADTSKQEVLENSNSVSESNAASPVSNTPHELAEEYGGLYENITPKESEPTIFGARSTPPTPPPKLATPISPKRLASSPNSTYTDKETKSKSNAKLESSPAVKVKATKLSSPVKERKERPRKKQRNKNSSSVSEGDETSSEKSPRARKESNEVPQGRSEISDSGNSPDKTGKTGHRRDLAPTVALLPPKPKPATKTKVAKPEQPPSSKETPGLDFSYGVTPSEEKSLASPTAGNAIYANFTEVVSPTQKKPPNLPKDTTQKKPPNLPKSASSSKESTSPTHSRSTSQDKVKNDYKNKPKTSKAALVPSPPPNSQHTQHQSPLSKARKMAKFGSNSDLDTVGTIDMNELQQKMLKAAARK